jgi:hypothetical protein
MGFFLKTHFRCNFFTVFHNTSASLIKENNAIIEVRMATSDVLPLISKIKYVKRKTGKIKS